MTKAEVRVYGAQRPQARWSSGKEEDKGMTTTTLDLVCRIGDILQLRMAPTITTHKVCHKRQVNVPVSVPLIDSFLDSLVFLLLLLLLMQCTCKISYNDTTLLFLLLALSLVPQVEKTQKTKY